MKRNYWLLVATTMLFSALVGDVVVLAGDNFSSEAAKRSSSSQSSGVAALPFDVVISGNPVDGMRRSKATVE